MVAHLDHAHILLQRCNAQKTKVNETPTEYHTNINSLVIKINDNKKTFVSIQFTVTNIRLVMMYLLLR
jgi:hypothetical protein